MSKGMIKVSVMYPNGEKKHFDMGYYLNKHLPLVGKLPGEKLKDANVDKGIGSVDPGSSAPYAGVKNNRIYQKNYNNNLVLT